MNILLDECVPWPLHRHLEGHTCSSPQLRGWSGYTNGALLKLVEGEFDCFVTADQNIQYQQRLTGRNVAIVLLTTNDLRRIVAAAETIQSVLKSIRRGEYVHIEIP